MSDPHAHAPTPSHDPHAVSHDAHHIQAHLKLYIGVGLTLLFLTIVTVWLSYIDFGSDTMNILIAMLVATFKVGLVAAIFMHLKGEKATIWRFLIFTLIFAAGLFLLTYLHWVDPIHGTTQSMH